MPHANSDAQRGQRIAQHGLAARFRTAPSVRSRPFILPLSLYWRGCWRMSRMCVFLATTRPSESITMRFPQDAGQRPLMGHHDDRHTHGGLNFLEQKQDLLTVDAVEVSGGFIRK